LRAFHVAVSRDRRCLLVPWNLRRPVRVGLRAPKRAVGQRRRCVQCRSLMLARDALQLGANKDRKRVFIGGCVSEN